MKITSINCVDYTAEQIITLLFDICPELQNNKRRRKQVFLGITNDIVRSIREHNITIDKIIFYAQTATLRVAEKVKKIARELGFGIEDVKHREKRRT